MCILSCLNEYGHRGKFLHLPSWRINLGASIGAFGVLQLTENWPNKYLKMVHVINCWNDCWVLFGIIREFQIILECVFWTFVWIKYEFCKVLKIGVFEIDPTLSRTKVVHSGRECLRDSFANMLELGRVILYYSTYYNHVQCYIDVLLLIETLATLTKRKLDQWEHPMWQTWLNVGCLGTIL